MIVANNDLASLVIMLTDKQISGAKKFRGHFSLQSNSTILYYIVLLYTNTFLWQHFIGVL
jgi:hypothetical protein